MDNSSLEFMYTKLQVSKYPPHHLRAVDWYLDCSARFVPNLEDVLHSSLTNNASIEMIDLVEP